MKARILNARGVRNSALADVANMLTKHILNVTVGGITPAEIRDGALTNTDILVIPGGDGEKMHAALNSDGLMKIQQHVEAGGKLIAIAEGAGILCGLFVHQSEMQYRPKQMENPHFISNARAEGPVNLAHLDSLVRTAELVRVSNISDNTLPLLYCHGSVAFSYPHHVDSRRPLGYYHGGHQDCRAAVLLKERGKGKALLCGPNIEVTHESRQDITPAHRDALLEHAELNTAFTAHLLDQLMQ